MDEIFIYADESVKKGKYYSNFYGGCLILNGDYHDYLNKLLNEKARELQINDEIKWNKVSQYTYPKYSEFIDSVFEEVKLGKIKLRIMFRHNRFLVGELTAEQKRNDFLLLYYQFLKHAFGLECFSPENTVSVNYRLDSIPQDSKRIDKFKQFIEFFNTNHDKLNFELGNIIEVCSKDYIILQTIDLILGAVQSKLNDQFKGMGRGLVRPERTIYKEKIYKAIYSHINSMLPNFNTGESTGFRGNESNKFHHNYRHWNFHRKNPVLDKSYKSKR
ncbi:hypothetical protein Lche_1099 [Legionella cherrii]|uniref:DUF3800 domain-containing protein n=1 Tax=Legionella cherrii TaxID=28084 RepID=A0A0W0S6N0_9GAMM|nr:DUF3800 domain-containing protein [Legionella cherrii]KTC79079.1 hypothetical protein Lche_1099 [Legionella cherrii]